MAERLILDWVQGCGASTLSARDWKTSRMHPVRASRQNSCTGIPARHAGIPRVGQQIAASLPDVEMNSKVDWVCRPDIPRSLQPHRWPGISSQEKNTSQTKEKHGKSSVDNFRPDHWVDNLFPRPRYGAIRKNQIDVIRSAATMEHPAGATPFLPKLRTLPSLRKAIQECEGCPLFRNATQAVFIADLRTAGEHLRRLGTELTRRKLPKYRAQFVSQPQEPLRKEVCQWSLNLSQSPHVSDIAPALD